MLMRGMGCGGGCMHDITGGRDSKSTTSTAPPSLSAAAAAPLSPGAPEALTGRLRGGRRKCHVCPSGRCPSRSLCITSPMEMSASEQSVESTCVRHATALQVGGGAAGEGQVCWLQARRKIAASRKNFNLQGWKFCAPSLHCESHYTGLRRPPSWTVKAMALDCKG